MSWEEQFEEEGREFEIDDRVFEVDTLMNEPRRRRRWADECKGRKEEYPLGPTKVSQQRGRAYWKGLPSTLTEDEWSRWRAAFGKCCAYCGDKQHDQVIDHVVPFKLDGGTTIYNVLPACQQCNSKKGRRSPWWWLNVIGWEPFLERLSKALEAMNEKT